MPTLVVVAQKALARFFVYAAPGSPFEPLDTMEHPRSAMHNADLVTDSPGAIMSPAGPHLHAAETATSPKEHEAAIFAREVAVRIRELRLSNVYDRAIVVAAPEFLGLLRGSLDRGEENFIAEEIPKNVASHDVGAIESLVTEALQVDDGTPKRGLSKEVQSLLN